MVLQSLSDQWRGWIFVVLGVLLSILCAQMLTAHSSLFRKQEEVRKERKYADAVGTVPVPRPGHFLC